MPNARPCRRWLVVLALSPLIALGVVLVVSKRTPRRRPEPVRPTNAVGDSTCISCHRNKASYEGTAHRVTMRAPTRESILGSFKSGENVLHTSTPDMHFRMDAESTGFYETLVVGKAPDTTSRTERIAYVAGSGRKGQSFLYWSADQLFQLPVSYWTSLHRWIGSPGRAGIDPRGSFKRAVAPRCLECHASWIESIPDPRILNHYRAEGAILGITCERCHASGQQHVKHERSLLRAVVGQSAIVNPARPTR